MNPSDPKGIDLSNMLHGVPTHTGLHPNIRPEFHSDTEEFLRKVVRLSRGYIKDEQQALYAVFGFIGIVVLISLYLLFSGGSGNQSIPQSRIDRAIPHSSKI